MATDPFLPLGNAPQLPAVEPNVGKGNGQFLGDLANGVSVRQLRANWKAGKYQGLNEALAKANMAFRGLA